MRCASSGHNITTDARILLLENFLTQWYIGTPWPMSFGPGKKKISDVVQRLDRAPCGDKDKINPQVNEMRLIVIGLEDGFDASEPNALKIGNPGKRNWTPSLV
jgi:hypothetical protein